ncbi:MAG: glycosyltransferase family 2 protein [Chthoniobacterales bacterium]
MTVLILAALVFAAWPALLFLRNLQIFTPPAEVRAPATEVSILIPARDEERNIGEAVEAALTNAGAEVLVLDDGSTDRTAEIVSEIAVRDPRVRLLPGAALPPGWVGKNWACAQLAKAATGQLLFFVDADVRLAPAAAASLGAWLRASGAQLASGLPRQQVVTLSEHLLIPLIHFVLLGFLPLDRMRRSRHPAYATGCGQLVLAKTHAYRASGGHSAIRDRIHDGLALPKRFREAGFQTDLFDATELSTCRMYRSDAETWRGLTKNTHEGLGAPARIVPVTAILLLGQVAPFALLAGARWLSLWQTLGALLAAALTLLPRLLAVSRFDHPLYSAVFHPVGVAALVGIQWTGLIRFLRGQPPRWKGRSLVGERVAVTNAGEQIPERVQNSID